MGVFVRAVDAGSFAAAGAALGLSGPMVGRHVKALEQHLGASLLNRTTRRQSLTDVGRVFYDRCKLVIAEMEAAEACAADLGASPRGRLRVDAPVAFGAHRLAPMLPIYLAEHPEVVVDLTLDNRLVDLIDEGYDAVIRVGRLADSGLIAKPLAPYRLVACAAPSYLKRRGVPRSPQDLESHSCLGFSPGLPHDTWIFEQPGGAAAPVRVSGPLSSNSGEALRGAALQGAGILLQSEALLGDDIAAGRLVRVLAEFEPRPLPMHVLFAPSARPTPKLRSFVEFLTRHFPR